jgi:hypothetical protein
MNDTMKNAQGHYVPLELVKPIDKIRDELVRTIIADAQALAETIAAFKAKSFAQIASFVSLSAQDHGLNWGGAKGNINLTSYDGDYKIVRAIDEYFTTNEQLQVAKELIDQCIHRWSADSNANIRALVQDAFQVDKRGCINIKRILGLRRLDIQDEQWQQAMAAISESLQVAGTKEYLRLYKKDPTGEYQQISLDVAR